MPPNVRALAVLALLAGYTLAADETPPFNLGACGGVMTGYDGKQYACEPDRKPACEQSSGGRCVCLERLDCGGTRDEPF